jgi:hypothetical protein
VEEVVEVVVVVVVEIVWTMVAWDPLVVWWPWRALSRRLSRRMRVL